MIIGPMFAGKTTHLIQLIKAFQLKKKSCLVLNHTSDSRFSRSSFIISHNEEVIPSKKISHLKEIISTQEYLNYDVVAIDEAQFFEDIVSGSDFLANEGKIVLVSGLDGTYRRKSFGNFMELIPLAENVTKLHAKCGKCGLEASFTKRINTEERKDILVGDERIYIPLCRKCFFCV